MQTEWREKLVNRFLKYVSIYTESEAFLEKFPSTDRQWDLANYLVEELKSIGLEDVSIDENGYVSGASEKDQYNGKIVFDGVVESAKTALANGIPVGLGNDVGCPYITQYDFWRELCYFHKYCGVSNQFALYTATLRNAQLAGVGDVTGSIEPGKSADFIVTKHNPLKDLRALQHLELVVCRGHVVKKPNPKRNKTVDALLDPYLA